MNKKERLKLYRDALWDYRKAYLFFNKHCKTESGFCYYFMSKEIRLIDLDELMLQRPKGILSNSSLWFDGGNLSPRIECLKKAIKLCKE